MSPDVEFDLDQLERSSRKAAVVSLLGFIFVLIAIAYAYVQLHKVEGARKKLEADEHVLQQQTQDYKNQLEVVRRQLSASRAALASARAAINAFHSGDFRGALKLYDEALRSDPDNAYLQNLRAYTLFRLNRVEDAIVGERRSVAIDPNYAWGYFDLARFLCAGKPPDLVEAQKAAQHAIALDARFSVGQRPDMQTIMENDPEFQRLCTPIKSTFTRPARPNEGVSKARPHPPSMIPGNGADSGPTLEESGHGFNDSYELRPKNGEIPEDWGSSAMNTLLGKIKGLAVADFSGAQASMVLKSTFKILGDGSVANVSIQLSSGKAQFDNAVRKAIEEALFPKSAPEQPFSTPIEVEFKVSYSSYSGSHALPTR